MKTFKITFFENFNTYKVETYHNVENQAAMMENIASNIVTLELDPMVKAEAEGRDYTVVVNHLLKTDIADINKNYARNWYANI